MGKKSTNQARKDFLAAQQKTIDCDMRTMSPGTVNEILSDMNASEADAFLERLGHVRARAIYDEASKVDHDAKG